LNLLHLGASRWETLNTTKLIPGPHFHGNEGNSARVTSSALGASIDSLILYLKETGEIHGGPHATRFIRMKAGMELREEEKGQLTCRLTSLSAIFMSCGFVVGDGASPPTTKDHTPPPLVKYEKRKHDKDWPDYSKSVPVCSWSSFLSVWKEEFPLMKIRAPSCDLCGECYIYKNAFHYKDAFLPEDLLAVDEGADEEALDEVAQEEEQTRLFIGKATTVMRGGRTPDVDKDDNSLSSNSNFRVLDITQEELDRIRTVTNQAEVAQYQERKSNEAILTCASGHVVMARVMCDMAKEETMDVLEDEDNNVVHSKRHYVLVGDYAQNLVAPHIGGAQPGDTYYFSPLTVFLFGLVEFAMTPNRMNCYAYAED
jgi:hypothetical protein